MKLKSRANQCALAPVYKLTFVPADNIRQDKSELCGFMQYKENKIQCLEQSINIIHCTYLVKSSF